MSVLDLLPGRLMVGQRTLTPSIVVRIHAGEPTLFPLRLNASPYCPTTLAVPVLKPIAKLLKRDGERLVNPTFKGWFNIAYIRAVREYEGVD